MLSRTARISKRAPCWSIRCQSQRNVIRFGSSSAHTAAATLLSDNTPPVTTHDITNTQNRRGLAEKRYGMKHPSVRTAFIRFWEPVWNIADIWAAKQVLEKKYGAILEISSLKVCVVPVVWNSSFPVHLPCVKDFEVPNKYQLMAFVVFRDTESLKRIPEDGEEFTLYAPEAPKNPHELSVRDLENLASSEDHQSGFQFDKPEPDTKRRIIGGHIKCSGMSFIQICRTSHIFLIFYFSTDTEFCQHPPHRSRFQLTTRSTMEGFLNWGGFSDAPMDTSRKVSESELFQPNAREEHARMRAALQLCAEHTSLAIPRQVADVEQVAAKGNSAGPSLQSARVFAGLYGGDSKPTLGRPKRDNTVDEQEKIVPHIEDKALDAASLSPTVDRQSSPSQLSGDKSAKLEDSNQSSLEPSPSSEPPELGPQKRPSISGEEKQKLESQLNAVRLLQKATTPVRRKQPKPAIVDVKKPKPRPRMAEPTLESEPQEKGGFLSKIMGLFGR